MNLQIVKAYIEDYKKNFERVHNQEIYKWKAIKHFQDNFDINSNEFLQNLEVSLAKAGNLLDSGRYFPKRMLLKNTEKSQEQIRKMFKNLFDENINLLERIKNFGNNFNELNNSNFGKEKGYQDHRAIIVYLTLKFPERYFFYKFDMFKKFAEKIQLTYIPKQGRIENIGQYLSLCDLIKYELQKDDRLLNLHKNRLGKEYYQDPNYNVLVQDFIYAVSVHLTHPDSTSKTINLLEEISIVNASELKSISDKISLEPKIINHIQINIENKRIGDLGEIWVLKHEIEYLKKFGKSKLADNVEHTAKNLGDGAGYDILSFDLEGNKKYIEVKTTKKSLNSTFYITRNELECSREKKECYFLYRLYELNEDNSSAKLQIIQGELTSICDTPVIYKVNLETE